MRRKVTCIKQSSEGIQKLDDNECITPKPSNIEACQGKCSPTQWRFSEWSNVSVKEMRFRVFSIVLSTLQPCVIIFLQDCR